MYDPFDTADLYDAADQYDADEHAAAWTLVTGYPDRPAYH